MLVLKIIFYFDIHILYFTTIGPRICGILLLILLVIDYYWEELGVTVLTIFQHGHSLKTNMYFWKAPLY